LVFKDILRVLYAPHKVFKDIIQNPRYLGAFIVLLLFVAAQTGFYYSLYSKTYYEQTSPSGDELNMWTEDATLWTASPEVTISNNYVDFINGTFFGNSSIQFVQSDSNNVSMEITSFDSVSCGQTGFQNLSMRMKLVEPQTPPEQVTLYLYSLNPSNYFSYDLTSDISSITTNVWKNLTVPVGSGNWLSSGDAEWENITGIKLDFTLPENSSFTLRVDGLFFRGIYQTPIDTYGLTSYIYILQSVFLQFLMKWLLITGLIYLIIKVLKGNVIWKPLMIAIGFALVITVVQALVNTAASLTLPSLYYPIEYQANVVGEAQITINAIVEASALFSITNVIIEVAALVWITALCAIIVRSLTEFSWAKSILTSATACIIAIIFLLPLISSL